MNLGNWLEISFYIGFFFKVIKAFLSLVNKSFGNSFQGNQHFLMIY